jgi:tRNA pseudouridine38-40 synthase
VGIAPEGFDARFSASWRRYAYRICDDPAGADPLQRRAVVPWPKPLDAEAMNQAAAQLLGEHDFAAFCKRRVGATTIRTLQALEWTRGDVLTAHVQADAFCHHMVRALTGSLVAVGDGRAPVEWPGDVLRAAVRDSRVNVLPARGLTFEEVGYPPAAELAERARTARSVRSLA